MTHAELVVVLQEIHERAFHAIGYIGLRNPARESVQGIIDDCHVALAKLVVVQRPTEDIDPETLVFLRRQAD